MNCTKILVNVEMSSAHGRNLMRGFARYSRLHDPIVLILPSQFDYGQDVASALIEHIDRLEIEAIVTRDFDPQIIEALRTIDIPKLYVSHAHSELRPSIQVDDIQVGRLAAEHFLERGFTRFAYCGLEPYFWSETRRESFMAEVAEAGYATDCFQLPKPTEDVSRERYVSLIAEWLKTLKTPNAIFACSDECAHMVVQACEICDLSLPGHIAVLGVQNDEFICDLSFIPLSSVVVDTEKAGFNAAKKIVEMVRGGTPFEDIIYCPAKYVETRRSTDILAIEDEHVAKALAYINSNIDQKLSVDAVAQCAGISNSLLNYRFQKYLSASIFEYINKLRIRRMCYLIENTNWTMLEIALAMGLPDDKHLHRYFRRHTGVTPLKWRKNNSTAD